MLPTAGTRGDTLDGRELSAWRGMLRAHSALIAELDKELRRAHGLPLVHYEVLLYLADSDDGELRMGELAQSLFLSRSGLTRLVDRLVRDGLVERRLCEDDRRGAFAALTAEGRDLFDAARPTHLAGVRRLFLSHLSGPELEQLGRIWERIVSAD